MHSAPTEFSDTRFLTGLRGYAAVGVFSVHILSRGFTHWPLPVHDFLVNGSQAVIAFFVISAFTLCMSIDRRPHFSAGAYAVRRFFRIAPLYYVILIFVFVFPQTRSPWESLAPFDVQSLAWHATFLNIFNYRQVNNAIGVEWSIPIEMAYYFALPALAAWSRSWLGCTLIIAGGVAALLIPTMFFTSPDQNSALAWDWSPVPFGIAFGAGVVTYRLWPVISASAVMRSGVPLAIVLAILVLWHPALQFEQSIMYYSSLTCIVILSGRSSLARILFANRVALLVGQASFSIYLVHLPLWQWTMRWSMNAAPTTQMIYILGVTCATGLIAWFFYARVERPANRAGHHFARRIEMHQDETLGHIIPKSH